MPKPNVFIIGAPRCMTTRIVSWLNNHPDVCTSKPKESKHFSINYHEGQPGIDRHYPDYDGEPIVVYSNPIDCNMEYVADRIHDYNPDAKIVMGIRSPINRLISHWGIHRYKLPIGRVHKNMWDTLDLNVDSLNKNKFPSEAEFIPYCNQFGSCYVPQYVECSLYHNMWAKWNKRFGDVFVYLTDDYYDDKSSLFQYNRLLKHIGASEVDKMPTNGDVNDLAAWGGKIDFSFAEMHFRDRYPTVFEAIVEDTADMSGVVGRDLVRLWGLDK